MELEGKINIKIKIANMTLKCCYVVKHLPHLIIIGINLREHNANTDLEHNEQNSTMQMLMINVLLITPR